MGNVQAYHGIIEHLKQQKDHLGMNISVLSERSGVSEPTVQRILSGKHPSAHFAHVLAIAQALGVDLGARVAIDAETMRREQAKKKAETIMRLVRGNSALEGQGLSPAAYQNMLHKTMNELLSGSKQALWG